jgi:hypothetical protein
MKFFFNRRPLTDIKKSGLLIFLELLFSNFKSRKTLFIPTKGCSNFFLIDGW